jgi:hypothetical protein
MFRSESDQETFKQAGTATLAGSASQCCLAWENFPHASFSLETRPLFGTSLGVTNCYTFRKPAPNVAAFGRAGEGQVTRWS